MSSVRPTDEQRLADEIRGAGGVMICYGKNEHLLSQNQQVMIADALIVAAAPESQPVEGLVERLNDEASKQITFSSDLTAPYVGQLLREAASALTAIPAREEVIVAAAVRTDDGAIHFMPKPTRHHHTIHALSRMLGPSNQRGVEGFVTSNGIFVNRIEAMLIATANGQLLKPSSKEELYSEDLW